MTDITVSSSKEILAVEFVLRLLVGWGGGNNIRMQSIMSAVSEEKCLGNAFRQVEALALSRLHIFIPLPTL